MKLKSVIFYQGVKLWDNNMYSTVVQGKNNTIEDITITIENHLVTLSCPKYEHVVIVGTSNMRCANAEKQVVESSFPEATELSNDFLVKAYQPIPENQLKIEDAAIEFDSSKYSKPADPKIEKPLKAPAMSKAEKLAAAKKEDK